MASDTAAPRLGEPLPVELMNTLWADRGGVHDELATPEGAAAWLRDAPEIPAVSREDLERWLSTASAGELADARQRLREFRDAARRLAAEQTADPRELAVSAVDDLARAVGIVNRAAAAAPRWSRLVWSGSAAAEPGRVVESAARTGPAMVAGIAEELVLLFSGDLRHDLRACLAPGCVLYFVRQHTRREWCSTACGNRARAARHYQRHGAGGRTR